MHNTHITQIENKLNVFLDSLVQELEETKRVQDYEKQLLDKMINTMVDRLANAKLPKEKTLAFITFRPLGHGWENRYYLDTNKEGKLTLTIVHWNIHSPWSSKSYEVISDVEKIKAEMKKLIASIEDFKKVVKDLADNVKAMSKYAKSRYKALVSLAKNFNQLFS